MKKILFYLLVLTSSAFAQTIPNPKSMGWAGYYNSADTTQKYVYPGAPVKPFRVTPWNDFKNGLDTKVPTSRQVNGHTLKNDIVISKTDVGLANADNTGDASKPVSTAQQNALNLKLNVADPTFTGTMAGPVINAQNYSGMVYSLPVNATTNQAGSFYENLGGTKGFKIYGTAPSATQSQVWFEAGDVASPFASGIGSRFVFHWTGGSGGTDAIPYILDYDHFTAPSITTQNVTASGAGVFNSIVAGPTNSSFSGAVTASSGVFGTLQKAFTVQHDNGYVSFYNTAGTVEGARLTAVTGNSIELSAQNNTTSIKLSNAPVTINAQSGEVLALRSGTASFKNITISNGSSNTLVGTEGSSGVFTGPNYAVFGSQQAGTALLAGNVARLTIDVNGNIAAGGVGAPSTFTFGGGTHNSGNNNVEIYGYRFWANIFEVSGGSAVIDFNSGAAKLTDRGASSGRTYFFGNDSPGNHQLAVTDGDVNFANVTTTGAVTSAGPLNAGQTNNGSSAYVRRLQLAYDGITGSAFAGSFRFYTNTTSFYRESANMQLRVLDYANNTEATIATFNTSGIDINSGGLTLRSPNGTRWLIGVNDAGSLTTTSY